MKRLWIAVVIGMGVLTVGCQAAGFSGAWTLTASAGPLSPLVLSMESALTITYVLNGCSIASVSAFGSGGWEGQEFSFRCSLGEFSVDSQLSFDPGTVAFDVWKTKVGWSSSMLSVSSAAELSGSGRSLSLATSMGNDPFSFGISFGVGANGVDCSMAFQSLSFSIQSTNDCRDLDADLAFSCTGFSSLSISFSTIQIQGLPWMTLAAKLTFEMDEKTLSLSPSVELAESGCFEVLSEIEFSGNLSMMAWSIYGLRSSAEIGPVRVAALAYLDDSHTVDGEYWESLTIGYNLGGCCGPVSGELTWLFLEGGIRVFDVARIRTTTSVSLSSQFAASGIADFDLEAGVCDEIALAFTVSW